ncbi:hypothetical protein ACS0TY_012655 [Phlomoides rotata]
MMRAVEEEKEILRSRLGFKGGSEEEEEGRQTRSLILENNGSVNDDHMVTSRSQPSYPLHDHEQLEQPNIGSAFDRKESIKSRLAIDGSSTNPIAKERQHSDMQLMKEKFTKLLLGEDMSGGGKGVSSAMALSNAITNLAASVFGEQKRLEPMAPETKARWRKEIDWLLSVTDHIVEFVPSKQNGSNMEIMVTRQRTDIHLNIPALRKLDAMLLGCLDNFKDQNEFYYASKDEKSEKESEARKDKWWIPTPKVPPNGLSEFTRNWLQFQKDSVNQVLKAAMAINAQVLSEMAIPENYVEALPKNGRESLGDSLYKSITDESFEPNAFISNVDLSSEHKILDLKNRIEASVEIWQRKMNAKDTKTSWGSAVSMEKRELFEERAKTILLILKHRFPGIPQSDLDISKIQYNKDVGLAILESYSRIIESLASTVLSRIEDVIQADALARKSQGAELKTVPPPRLKIEKTLIPKEDNSAQTPTSMTLSDFMGWEAENGGAASKKDKQDEVNVKSLSKPANAVTEKKWTYIERLEILGGIRSPTARH